jgi:hypothetical protein
MTWSPPVSALPTPRAAPFDERQLAAVDRLLESGVRIEMGMFVRNVSCQVHVSNGAAQDLIEELVRPVHSWPRGRGHLPRDVSRPEVARVAHFASVVDRERARLLAISASGAKVFLDDGSVVVALRLVGDPLKGPAHERRSPPATFRMTSL